MSTQELIDELRLQMKEVQEKSQEVKMDKKITGDIVTFGADGKAVFNPQYISVEEYNQIVELEKFLHKHPDLNDRDLRSIFRGNVFYFSFLEGLRKSIPGFAQTVRAFGAGAVAGILIGTKLQYTDNYEL